MPIVAISINASGHRDRFRIPAAHSRIWARRSYNYVDRYSEDAIPRAFPSRRDEWHSSSVIRPRDEGRFLSGARTLLTRETLPRRRPINRGASSRRESRARYVVSPSSRRPEWREDRFPSSCDCCGLTTSKFVKRALLSRHHRSFICHSSEVRRGGTRRKMEKKKSDDKLTLVTSFLVRSFTRGGGGDWDVPSMYNNILGVSGVRFAFLSGHEIWACWPLSPSACLTWYYKKKYIPTVST